MGLLDTWQNSIAYCWSTISQFRRTFVKALGCCNVLGWCSYHQIAPDRRPWTENSSQFNEHIWSSNPIRKVMKCTSDYLLYVPPVLYFHMVSFYLFSSQDNIFHGRNCELTRLCGGKKTFKAYLDLSAIFFSSLKSIIFIFLSRFFLLYLQYFSNMKSSLKWLLEEGKDFF